MGKTELQATHTGGEAFKEAARVREAEEAVTRKREREEARADADEARMKRYRPTLDECKDKAVPESDACHFVFETDVDGTEVRAP